MWAYCDTAPAILSQNFAHCTFVSWAFVELGFREPVPAWDVECAAMVCERLDRGPITHELELKTRNGKAPQEVLLLRGR